MIFYFTGTGNSLMAAKALVQEGERLVDMAQALKEQAYEYELAGERLGFVFPVYCYTLPEIVLDFVRHSHIAGSGYGFAVVTCGGSMGGTAAFLAKELVKKNVSLDYAVSLLMPDNAIFYYAIKPKEQTDARLAEAQNKLCEIKAELEKERRKPAKGLSSKWLLPMYRMLSKTKGFAVNESCIGCGFCRNNCPSNAIEMREGKPAWVKERCAKCSACINRCPKCAIEYGKATQGRLRYVNPIFNGGKKA